MNGILDGPEPNALAEIALDQDGELEEKLEIPISLECYRAQLPRFHEVVGR